MGKLSFTSMSSFNRCKRKYQAERELGVWSRNKGASLDFGSIIDKVTGLQYQEHHRSPEEKSDYVKIFMEHKAESKYDSRGWNYVFDDPYVHFSTADIDKTLFNKEDMALIKEWEKELKVSMEDAIKKEKAKKYGSFYGNVKQMYNRLGWLSMGHKGLLLLESNQLYVLPKIEEVISVQHEVKGTVDGAPLIGYIDLIAMFNIAEEGKKEKVVPVVFDVKTAAKEYDYDAIDRSVQLQLYLSSVTEDLDTRYTGYIVFPKNIPKDSVCSLCGKKKKKGSRVKKCDYIYKKKRCNGEFIVTPIAPEPQIMFKELSEEVLEANLTNITMTAKLIDFARSTGYFPQDFDRCSDYGKCEFYDACFKKKIKMTDFTGKVSNLKKIFPGLEIE